MEDYKFKDDRIACSTTLLGTGGFGEVYLGSCDGQEAAIKRVLLTNLDANEPKREEEFLSKFHHRNIVRLLHVTEDSNFK